MIKEQRFYAYTIPQEHKSGITNTWKECEAKVRNAQSARFKSFSSKESAKEWIAKGAHYEQKEIFRPGIYFDAGTGRGNGVEVSVTNEKWETLLPFILPASKINSHGKYLVGNDITNNYGELLACSFALQIALKLKAKKIYGDSSLIINYWSHGFMKKNLLPLKTVQLAENVKALQTEFKAHGGTIELISGSANPADLGFH